MPNKKKIKKEENILGKKWKKSISETKY